MQIEKQNKGSYSKQRFSWDMEEKEIEFANALQRSM